MWPTAVLHRCGRFVGSGMRRVGACSRWLLRFGWLEACSCIFAAGVFAGLVVTQVVPLPIAAYDFLLIWCVALTLVFWAIGVETWREVLVIVAFHLLGLGLELFKVRMGSWSYPGEAVAKIGGVPLFSGFMYAAVGSYICQAWRRFDLRLSHYHPWPTTVVAVGIYANFFTHHWTVDLRIPLAVAGLFVLRRTVVHFTVGRTRNRMPLALAFVLIGLFLWLAENAATFLDAWKYSDQLEVWTAVHPSKIGAWSLLVTMSFVLVATVKAQEGRLYQSPRRDVGRLGEQGDEGHQGRSGLGGGADPQLAVRGEQHHATPHHERAAVGDQRAPDRDLAGVVGDQAKQGSGGEKQVVEALVDRPRPDPRHGVGPDPEE